MKQLAIRHIRLLQKAGFLSLMLGICVPLLQAQISTFPYMENFDSGPGGWTPSVTGGVGWSLGPPNKDSINFPSSSPNSWITGNLSGNYASNASSYVQSPAFDFSNLQNPAISFNVWWECEHGFDGAALAASTDNGMTWNVIGGYLDPVAWYNSNAVSGGFNGGPCSQSLGWSGRDATGNGSQGWIPAQHALDGLAGQPNVLLRFCFASDFGTEYDGFAFDDVIIADAPVIDLGNDTIICFSDTIFLDACVPSAVSFQWNTSPVDTLCTKVAVSSNIYIVEVIDSLGFSARDTFNLFVSPTDVNLPPDQLICPGDTLLLDAGNPNANHLWQPGNVMSQTFPATQTGSYFVTVTDNFGCEKIDSIDILVDVVPVVDLGEDTTICIGETILLDAGAANPGITYAWNVNNANTQTLIVSAPGLYVVDVTTVGNCMASDSVNIGVSLKPVVDLGPDRVECGEFTLNANNAGSHFLWNTNDTTQTLTTAIPGNYSVTVTNLFGCVGADSVSIAIGSTPIVNLGPDQVVCNGSSVTLDLGNPGSTYFWSTGETTQTIQVSSPGTFTGQVTNQDGCKGRDTVKVVLSPLTVDLGPDLTVCEGDSTELDAGDTGTSYQWSTGASSQVIYPTTGGSYRVTVSDALNCIARDTVVLNAQPDFNVDFTVTDSAVLYQSLQFSEQSGGNPNTWHWDFGDGDTSALPNPVHAYQSIGTFVVCLTASDGVCTNTICKDVKVDIFVVDDIEEALGLEWRLYPNPSRGWLQVDLSLKKHSPIALNVISLTGQTVWRKAYSPRAWLHSELDLQSLSKGMYLLKIDLEGGSVYRRLILH